MIYDVHVPNSVTFSNRLFVHFHKQANSLRYSLCAPTSTEMSDNDTTRLQKVEQLCETVKKADAEGIRKIMKSSGWKAEWINCKNGKGITKQGIVNSLGYTPLYLACQNGSVEVVEEVLLCTKLDLDIQCGDTQRTALHSMLQRLGVDLFILVACLKAHQDVVNLLLQNGANTKIPNSRGVLALDEKPSGKLQRTNTARGDKKKVTELFEAKVRSCV